jgi:hypothetical protein
LIGKFVQCVWTTEQEPSQRFAIWLLRCCLLLLLLLSQDSRKGRDGNLSNG